MMDSSVAPVEADIFVLAAGFGSRLRPLTDNCPKPLIEVGGRTLLDRTLTLIARSGFRRAIINLHYLGDQIRQFVGDGSRWGLEISFSPEDPILDTGGGIRNVEGLLSQSLLVCINSDTLFEESFALADVVAAHQSNRQQPVATVVVRRDAEAKAYGALGLSEEGRVLSFREKQYIAGEATREMMYAGVQVLDRRVFAFMPPAGSIFSITGQTWVDLLRAGEWMAGYEYKGCWSDVGTLQRLQEVRENIGNFGGVMPE